MFQLSLKPIKIKHFIHRYGTVFTIIEPNSFDDLFYFDISFRTFNPPKSGLPHITEHVVLTGSRRFKTQDLFFDLARQAPLSILNASTYTAFTSYYFASSTEKLLAETIPIYLDAVFNPLFDKYRVLSEGVWVKKIPEKTTAKNPQDLKKYVSGVVFNEMLGAASEPTPSATDIFSKVYRELSNLKHSDGYPPELVYVTYEDIKRFHAERYTSDNAHILLYGKFKNLDAILAKIEEFLKEARQETNYQEVTVLTVNRPPKNPIRLEINATSKMAKHHLIFAWPLPFKKDDVSEFFATTALLNHLFDPQCGPAKDLIKKDPLLQNLDFAVLNPQPVNLYILEVKNLAKNELEPAARSIDKLIKKALQNLNIQKLNRLIQTQFRKELVFDETPFIERFVYDLHNFVHGLKPNTQSALKALFSPSLVDSKTVSFVRKVLNQPFKFHVVPNPSYMQKITAKVIKNLRKATPQNAKPIRYPQSTLIRPKISFVKKKPQQPLTHNAQDNRIFFKRKNQEISAFEIRKELIPSDSLMYFPLFKKLFANTRVYPNKYARLKCNDLSTHLSGIKLKKLNDLNYKPHLQTAFYLISLKGKEADAARRYQKALEFFDAKTINTKNASLQIQDFIKSLFNLPPTFYLGLGESYLLSDINPTFAYNYLVRYQIVQKILNNQVSIKEILAGVFNLFKHLVQPGNGQIFGLVGGISKRNQRVADVLAASTNTELAPPPAKPKAAKIKPANINHTDLYHLKLTLPSAHASIIGITKIKFKANEYEKKAAYWAALNFISEHIAQDIGRINMHAYGAAFLPVDMYPSLTWKFLLYWLPNGHLKHLDKTLKLLIEKIKASKPTEQQVKILALKGINSITAPKDILDLFTYQIDSWYKFTPIGYEHDKALAYAFANLTVNKVKEAMDSLVEEFKVRKVIIE